MQASGHPLVESGEGVGERFGFVATPGTCHIRSSAPPGADLITHHLDHSDAATMQRTIAATLAVSVKADMSYGMLSDSESYEHADFMRWAAGNAVVRMDPAGNRKLDKAESTEKIDPLVALAMAIGRAIVEENPWSVYDTRAAVVLEEFDL